MEAIRAMPKKGTRGQGTTLKGGGKRLSESKVSPTQNKTKNSSDLAYCFLGRRGPVLVQNKDHQLLC